MVKENKTASAQKAKALIEHCKPDHEVSIVSGIVYTTSARAFALREAWSRAKNVVLVIDDPAVADVSAWYKAGADELKWLHRCGQDGIHIETKTTDYDNSVWYYRPEEERLWSEYRRIVITTAELCIAEIVPEQFRVNRRKGKVSERLMNILKVWAHDKLVNDGTHYRTKSHVLFEGQHSASNTIVVGTNLTCSKTHALFPLLRERLNDAMADATWQLFGNAIDGVDRNLVNVRGSNSYQRASILAEVSYPVVDEMNHIQENIKNLTQGEARAMLMLDRVNQAARNQGYRYHGSHLVVFVPQEMQEIISNSMMFMPSKLEESPELHGIIEQAINDPVGFFQEAIAKSDLEPKLLTEARKAIRTVKDSDYYVRSTISDDEFYKEIAAWIGSGKPWRDYPKRRRAERQLGKESLAGYRKEISLERKKRKALDLKVSGLPNRDILRSMNVYRAGNERLRAELSDLLGIG